MEENDKQEKGKAGDSHEARRRLMWVTNTDQEVKKMLKSKSGAFRIYTVIDGKDTLIELRVRKRNSGALFSFKEPSGNKGIEFCVDFITAQTFKARLEQVADLARALTAIAG
jgi:hypothetical protein